MFALGHTAKNLWLEGGHQDLKPSSLIQRTSVRIAGRLKMHMRICPIL